MPLGKVSHRRVSDETDREIIAWNQQRIATQRELAEKYRLQNEIVRAQVLNKSKMSRRPWTAPSGTNRYEHRNSFPNPIRPDCVASLPVPTGEGVLRRARSCLSWFYCCKSGTFGARSNAGGATLPAVVNGNSMLTRAANIATELSLHSPPCSQIISFGTRTIQQGTRALPV